MQIHVFDPDTLRYLDTVDSPTSIPWNSTLVPPLVGFTAPQYFVDGLWTFDNPFTSEVESPYPVFAIEDITLSNTRLDNAGIWNGKTKEVIVLSAQTQIPAGEFTAIVQKVVEGKPINDIRYDATITAGETVNTLTLPLYFEESGNYVITAERLNRGLAEIKQVFRVEFPKVDINITVKIPT